MIKELSLSISQLLGISTAISFLVVICICALWTIWLNRIKEGQKAEFQKQIEKQKSEFTKEIENLKAKNEKLNYISKTQFDAEFKIYRELSDFSFQMLLSTILLFPKWDSLPKDKKEQQEIFKERYKKAQENFMLFQNTLHKNAPFISKELFDLFEKFREENRLQIIAYENVKFEEDEECRKEYRKNSNENRKRTDLLMKMNEEITDKLREYLKSLKVLED